MKSTAIAAEAKNSNLPANTNPKSRTIRNKSRKPYIYSDDKEVKVFMVMYPFTMNFIETNSPKYPYKASLHIFFDSKNEKFYIATRNWSISLSTDVELDAKMWVMASEYHGAIYDDALELVCAIRAHRHDFVNEINKTLSKTNKRSALPLH